LVILSTTVFDKRSLGMVGLTSRLGKQKVS